MPAIRQYTLLDLANMPDDGQRYELVRGELLVTPAPGFGHQAIIGRLFAELHGCLKRAGLTDQLLTSPADITLAPDTLVQPDLFVADTAAVRRSKKWTDVTNLFLVIEVSSPSTARFDQQVKRPEYQRYGVPYYWIVDPDLRQVEMWTPDATAPIIEREQMRWRHPAIDEHCVVDLERLFDLD